MSAPLVPPWRSVWFARAAVVVAVVVGVPLFLRMPLWCDVTLYQAAAQNLLDGGVHYRDVFDTNLPGFVWAVTGLRWVFGPDPVFVRLADLAIVCGVLALIDRLAKWAGATPSARWWFLAGAAYFYLYAPEMVHAQRDVWMALPVMAAVVLRVRRAVAEPSPGVLGRVAGRSAVEGLLWGAAVWVKPHVLPMALMVWVLTARRVAAATPRPWAAAALDLLGNLAGGLAVGLAGVGWLLGSGTWPYFWDVFTVWNPDYAKLADTEFKSRVPMELHWFPPWSLWLLPTVPLALLSLLDAPWTGRGGAGLGPVGRVLPGWLWDRDAGQDARVARGVLAGLYLVWAAQSFFLQRAFVYVHVVETFLMLAVWASHRWAMSAAILLWVAVTSGLWLAADANPSFRERLLTVATDRHSSAHQTCERYVVRHPLAEPDRLRNWLDCWRFGMPPRERAALADRLRRITDHEAVIGNEELEEVAEFLRAEGVGDGEVIAWHDSPHAVYLMLRVRPGVRFMHVGTAMMIGPPAAERVFAELAASRNARYAVGDLEWCVGDLKPESRERNIGPPGTGGDLLPAELELGYRASFPFNQQTVFRSRGGLGRYTVHKLTPPLGNGLPPKQ